MSAFFAAAKLPSTRLWSSLLRQKLLLLNVRVWREGRRSAPVYTQQLVGPHRVHHDRFPILLFLRAGCKARSISPAWEKVHIAAVRCVQGKVNAIKRKCKRIKRVNLRCACHFADERERKSAR